VESSYGKIVEDSIGSYEAAYGAHHEDLASMMHSNSNIRGAIFGVVVMSVLAVTILYPEPSLFQITVFRFLLALGIGGGLASAYTVFFRPSNSSRRYSAILGLVGFVVTYGVSPTYLLQENVSVPIGSGYLQCAVTPNGFAIQKSPNEFVITYKNRRVTSIGGADLQHEIFGGKPPYINCNGIVSTSDAFFMTVGWKMDNLIAFGIERNILNTPTKLRMFRWFPRDEPLTLSAFENSELGQGVLVTYGRLRDLQLRMCWRNNSWYFSGFERDANKGRGCEFSRPQIGREEIFAIP